MSYNPIYDEEKWRKLYNRDTVWQGAGPICKAMLYLTNAQSVLDVGCGRGDFLAFFERHVPSLGVDLSRWMCENKFCESEIKMENCTKMSMGDQSYDLVVGLDICEHLSSADLKLMLLEMKRIARKAIVLLPSALLCYENETELHDSSIDLAGHLIYWREDRWLDTMSSILEPEFEFDAEKVIRFTSILERQHCYPGQWRHIEFFIRRATP